MISTAQPVTAPPRGNVRRPVVRQWTPWLLLIAAVALLLRCTLISKESLWLDEAASWWLSNTFQRAIHGEATNPPLYYILLLGWRSLLGSSEAALRSFSILPSVAAVLLTFAIADRLFSRPIALIAALYQSVSTFHIYYAQEARAFAWLLFFLSLTFYVLLKALDYPERTRYWAAYAVCVALSFYTHFIATFFVALQGLYVLIRNRREFPVLMRYAAAILAASLSFLPWIFQMLQAAASRGQYRRYLFLKVPQTYFSFLFGDTLIPLDEYAVQHIPETLLEYSPIILTGLILFLILSGFALRETFRMNIYRWLPLPILGIGPIALSLFISLVKVRLFDERYVIAASPFVYMFIATGITAMWNWTVRQKAVMRVAAMVVTVVYCSLLAQSMWNYYRTPRFGREQWREAMKDIQAEGGQQVGQPGTLLVYEPDYNGFCVEYYQSRPLRQIGLSDPLRQAIASSDAFTAEMIGVYKNVWFIRSHYSGDAVLQTLQRVLHQDGYKFYPKANGIEVYHFRGRSAT